MAKQKKSTNRSAKTGKVVKQTYTKKLVNPNIAKAAKAAKVVKAIKKSIRKDDSGNPPGI